MNTAHKIDSPKTHSPTLPPQIKPILLATLATLAIILSAVFTLFGLNAGIIADDFAYFNSYNEQGSALAFIKHHFLTHNGRFGQNLFFTALYTLFGTKAIIVTPVILFFCISLLIASVLKSSNLFSTHKNTAALSLGVIVTSVSLTFSPSMHDSLLWLTSSTVYLGALLFTLVAFLLAIRTARGSLQTLPGLALTFVSFTFAAGFSEPLAVCTGLANALILGRKIFNKKKLHTAIAGAALAGSLLGFAIVYFSLGTVSRRAEVSHQTGLLSAIRSTYLSVYDYLLSIPLWSAVPLMLIVALCYTLIPRAHKIKISPLKTLIYAALTFTVFVITHTFLAIYGGGYLALRVFTVPGFATTATLALVALSACALADRACPKRLQQPYSPGYKTLAPAAVAMLGVSLLYFAVNFSQFSAVSITALTSRSHYLEQRATDVAEQLSTDSTADHKTVEITALPIMLKSEAFDLSNPPEDSIPWVRQEILKWYGVADAQEVTVKPQPENYCARAHYTVKPEYRCDS